MRFDVRTTTAKPGMSGRNRLRLWLLVASLGIVLAAMHQLRQQKTIDRLDQLFGVNTAASTEDDFRADAAEFESGGQSKNPIAGDHAARAGALPDETEPVANPPQPAGQYDRTIEDNTYFRPEERQVWFDVFEQLESKSFQKLQQESVGEIAYAQFVKQPDEYRHKIVTLQGTVVREEPQRPGKNPVGIDRYHRLWISPRGGGQWPFVVFCRELPDEFPRGDQLHESVTVVGSFFKNWSYSYGEGLGLAPVVLANSVVWEPPPVRQAQKPLPISQLIWATAAAGVTALGVVWFAIRRTMRPAGVNRELPESIVESDLPTPDTSGDGL